VPIGGSQAIADSLADDLRAHGGTIETGIDVTRLDEVREAKAVLLDISVPSLIAIADEQLPDRYVARLRRFRRGQAVCKVDFALSAPVPWTNPDLSRTATIHLGGTRAEIAAAENGVMRGRHPDRPYVLMAQPSLVDGSRAPAGKHVLWAYTHVPNGSTEDRTEAIVRQVERYAPGFRETILASTSRTAAELAIYNPNYPGGDISGGALAFWQLVGRPVVSVSPWRTPVPGVYLCSGSTPPGPSVHGMCGWYAARTALRDVFGIRAMPNLGLDG
jgi:phytoene dehydrogenase-like protein